MSVFQLRRDYLKTITFGCVRYFYSENGDLMPTSFEFVTEEVNEMMYTWKIDYKLDNNKSLINAKRIVVLESGMRRVDDQNFFISQITVGIDKKLISSDSADVTIFVNGEPVSEPLQFNSQSPLSMISKLRSKFTVKGPSIIRSRDGVCVSVIDIFIKIERKCDENPCSNQMVNDYARLLKNETLSDVKFIFNNNKELSAHSQILSARNPVFASMFASDMLEKKNGRVEITDIESNIFKHLLQFIYSEELAIYEMSEWLRVIVAADKYSMTSLVKICENHVLNNLSTPSVIDVFITADLVNSEVLKEKCVKFINNNKSDVVKTATYKNLVDSRPDLATKLLRYLLEKNL